MPYNKGMIFDFLFKKKDDMIKEPIHVEPSSGEAEPSGKGSMRIEDVFSIAGRGTVVTGKVKGTIHINDAVLITTKDGRKIETVLGGIEAFRKTLDVAMDGDNCGLLLKNVARDEVSRDDMIEVV
jgi:translation elongation factor EF-Tu-like GTPase